MAMYQVLYWKHIPAQVKVFEDGKRPLSRQMPDRFQIEIDRIAMKDGLSGNDDYLDQWRWTPKRERAGTAEEVADALLRELEQQARLKEGSET
jgi:Virulence factor